MEIDNVHRHRALRLGRQAILSSILFGVCLLTLLAAAAVLTDAVPWVRGPGAWPPSWRWLHAPLGMARPGRLLGHASLLAAYGIAVAWLTGSARVRARWTLLAAALFAVLWQLAQTWVREVGLLDTMIFRTYAPPLNGYFLAPAQVESISATLHDYVTAMPTFFGDKPQTHPPGLFLFYAFFQELFARLPALSEWFAPIARGWAIPGRDWVELNDLLVTSAFVTSWIQALLLGLTPLTLYAFVRQLRAPSETRSRTLALWAAVLVPLVPSLTLFFLQWDTLYPALGWATWFFALRGQNRLAQIAYHGWGQWLDWLWAGLILSVLTWLSFGNLVFGLMIGLHLLWREGVASVEHRNRFDPLLYLPLLGGLVLMGIGVVLPWLLAYAAWDMNFFALLRAGLDAHYQIVTAHRDYATWIWMNVVDFVLWTGPAPVLLGALGSGWLIGAGWRQRPWRDWVGLALVVWVVFLLLDVSGTTRGEIGRLWIFLMPFPVLFALILPWNRRQRIVILVLLMIWTWVLAYSIPPFLCC